MTKSKVDLSKLKKWTDVKDSIQQFLNNLGSSGVLELQNWLNEYPIRNRKHRVATCAFPMRVAYVKDPEQYKLKFKEFASGLGCTFEFTEYSDYGDRFLTATLSVARDKDWCRLNGIQLPEREVPIVEPITVNGVTYSSFDAIYNQLVPILKTVVNSYASCHYTNRHKTMTTVKIAERAIPNRKAFDTALNAFVKKHNITIEIKSALMCHGPALLIRFPRLLGNQDLARMRTKQQTIKEFNNAK